MNINVLTEWKSTLLGVLIIILVVLNWFAPEMTIRDVTNWLYLGIAAVIIFKLAWPTIKK